MTQTFTTRNRHFTTADRSRGIYIITKSNNTLNEAFDGQKVLGFFDFYGTQAKAEAVAVKEHSKEMVQIQCLAPGDDVIYTGGAQSA